MLEMKQENIEDAIQYIMLFMSTIVLYSSGLSNLHRVTVFAFIIVVLLLVYKAVYR